MPSCETSLERPIQAELLGLDGSFAVAKGAKGPVKPPPNGLKRLEEKLTKNPTFPTYVKQNFEGFTKVLGKGGRTKWDEVADWWATENVLTGDKRVSASSMKRAYDRERARRAKLAKEAEAKPSSVKPAQSVRSAPPVRIFSEPAKPAPEAPKPDPDPSTDDLSASLDAGRYRPRTGKRNT